MESLIPGVREIRCFHHLANGIAFPVESQQMYVGTLGPADDPAIEIHVDPGAVLFPIVVDGKKNVHLARDHSDDPGEVNVYRVKTPIKEADQQAGIFHTEYPNNNIRVLMVSPEGKLSIWEIALVSQRGVFFCTVQKVYDDYQIYSTGDSVFLPAPLNGWGQLIELLNTLMRDCLVDLPSSEECPAQPKLNGKQLADHAGRVVWYSWSQGFGCLLTNKRDLARVHWENLQIAGLGDQEMVSLSPGDMVTIERLDDPRRTKWRATGFRKEAFGVSRMQQEAAS